MWVENSPWELNFWVPKGRNVYLPHVCMGPHSDPQLSMSTEFYMSLILVLPVTRWLLPLSFSLSVLLSATVVNFSSSMGPGVLQGFYGFLPFAILCQQPLPSVPRRLQRKWVHFPAPLHCVGQKDALAPGNTHQAWFLERRQIFFCPF